MNKVIELIGAPTDVGAADRGASMGPEALRVAGITQALSARWYTVRDKGNLQGPKGFKGYTKKGYKNLDEVLTWNTAVYESVRASLSKEAIPILLGGDHSLAVGSISAVARHCVDAHKKLRVIWLDAHADFNTPAMSPSGNMHGMPLALLCGLGQPKLSALSSHAPAILPEMIRQIGIRSVDDGERRLIHELGVEVFDMRHIDEVGMRRTMQNALSGLGPDAHLHVSFDVDFLDPAFAPGVGTTVQGGPTYREAQLCMEMLHDTLLVGSVDIVELNPALDIKNKTAKVAVDLVESLFGKTTLISQNRPTRIIS